MKIKYTYRQEPFGSLCYDSDFDKIYFNESINKFPLNCTRVVENKYPNISKLSAPISVFWELTQKCNSQCLHCLNSRTNKSEDVSLKEAKIIIDRLFDSGIFLLKISGGEPFSRADIFDILDYLESKMIKFIIYSNGTYLNKTMVSRLRLYHYLKSIRVSIDGIEKTNDFIRGNGMFQSAINALKLLSLNKISCEINYTITKLNYKELIKLSKFLHEIKLNVKINIGTLKITSKVLQHKSLIIPQEDVEKIMEEIKAQIISDSSFLPYKLLPDFYLKIWGDSFGCPAGRISISVDGSGNVFGCGMFSDNDDFICGNLIRDDLTTIWNCERLRYLRNISIREECLACSHYTKSCTGGCRGNALSCFANISAEDINCSIYKLKYTN